MPHIIIGATDMEKNLQTISLHVELTYKSDFLHDKKRMVMQEQIMHELEQVVAKYLPDFESEMYSNHEYNKHL